MDIDALRTLLAVMNRGVLSEDDAQALFGVIQEVTGADAIIVGQEWGRFGGLNRSINIPPDWAEAYGRLQHQDPGKAFLASRPVGSWFFINADSTPKECDTELYRTFREFGFRDGAITLLPASGAPIALVLYRRGDQDFDADDRVLLELLHPHFRRAFGRARSARAWAGEVDGARQPNLERLAHARVSATDRSVTWSASAEALFEGLLRVPFDRQRGRLERMVHRAIAGDSGAAVPLLADVYGDVLSVRGDDGLVDEVVVLLERWDEPSDSDAALSPAEELLSPRQRTVARLVATGASLPDVAERLGMSTETARSHLKAVYERLAVTERSSLSHLLRD